MSKYSFRRRGGQEGIEVTNEELNSFADFMESKYLDKYIPLPNVEKEVQKERMNGCTHKDAEYWETDKGSHGWCCSHCGTVVQWG